MLRLFEVETRVSFTSSQPPSSLSGNFATKLPAELIPSTTFGLRRLADTPDLGFAGADFALVARTGAFFDSLTFSDSFMLQFLPLVRLRQFNPIRFHYLDGDQEISA